MRVLWKIRVFALLVCGLYACGRSAGVKSLKEIEVFPGEYVVDKPEHIAAYFDSLCQYSGAEVWTHTPEEDSVDVWKAVKELDRYAKGERKYYPAEELRKALGILAFEQGYAWSHGMYEGEEGEEESDVINPGEAFLFRLLEQAARFCPRIELLADFHSPDQRAGVLYYPEWSASNPLYSFLLYRSGDEFKVKMIGGKASTAIDKIYKLEDKQGQVYYLCSNNFLRLYFCQYLYRMQDGEMELVCSVDDFPGGEMGDYTIVFNPTKHCWTYCEKKGEYYHQIKGTRTLYLDLDQKKPAFRLNE